jgi:hypothetical protein
MQILRQLFTVTDADGYVPKSFLQPGDTPVEDDPNSDSDDEIMDTNNGHTERERTYKQEPVPVTNLRDTYGTDPDDTPEAWRYGADALESHDFSIEHPLEDGLKLFFMTDPTHVLKSRWTSDPTMNATIPCAANPKHRHGPSPTITLCARCRHTQRTVQLSARVKDLKTCPVLANRGGHNGQPVPVRLGTRGGRIQRHGVETQHNLPPKRPECVQCEPHL